MKALIALVLLFSFSSFALVVKDEKVILEKLDDYKFCQSKDYTGDWCHRALVDWVEGHRDDAWEAAKLTRLHMNHSAAVPFFITAQKGNKFDCKDEDLKLAVVNGLDKPADYDVVKPSLELLRRCKAEIAPGIAQTATTDSYLFKNACKELGLQGLKKKKCTP